MPLRPSARRRVLVSALVGVVVGVAVGMLVDPFLGLGVGWIAASGAYLLRVWSQLPRMRGRATLEHAAAEDPSRGTTHAAALTAAVLSLVAVVFALARGQAEDPPMSVVHIVVGVAIVVLSWSLVHTLYTLRYAHLYTQSDETTPIDFNQSAPPDYLDFAYLAFTLGMTYQVSDTNIADSRVRRAALGHSLVSFVFGVVILATTINLLAGMMTQTG